MLKAWFCPFKADTWQRSEIEIANREYASSVSAEVTSVNHSRPGKTQTDGMDIFDFGLETKKSKNHVLDILDWMFSSSRTAAGPLVIQNSHS